MCRSKQLPGSVYAPANPQTGKIGVGKTAELELVKFYCYIFGMKKALLAFILTAFAAFSQAQSVQELRARKKDTEKQILYSNSLLEDARKSEVASVGKLGLLNSQIGYRTQLIEAMNQEIEVVDWTIGNNSQIIGMLQTDLAKMKQEYAAMVRFAQKSRNTYDLLIFLFSAENTNQAYKRWLYLRQYARYRRSQAEVIASVSVDLQKNLAKLEEKKTLKTKLLDQRVAEYQTLEEQRSEQDQLIARLQRRQQDLRGVIREQERRQAELDRQIEKTIEEEALKARKKPGGSMSSSEKLVSTDFEKNKGRIPWPVEHGVITDHFGIHQHPVLKQIQVRNNGVDISTGTGAKARSVFAGEVSRVFAISGGNMAVIIRHGAYLTVYSNLKDVLVKAGQKVALNEEIGTIFTNISDGNNTVLKFQVWRESEKLNPEEWISR